MYVSYQCVYFDFLTQKISCGTSRDIHGEVDKFIKLKSLLKRHLFIFLLNIKLKKKNINPSLSPDHSSEFTVYDNIIFLSPVKRVIKQLLRKLLI